MTIAEAINRVMYAGQWPCIDASDGLTHRLYGFDRRLAVWRYMCGATFLENAHQTTVSTRPVTCMACSTDVFVP